MFSKQLLAIFNISDTTFLGLDDKDADRDPRELCAKFAYADDPAAPNNYNCRLKLKREDLHGLPGQEGPGAFSVYKARETIAGKMQLDFASQLTKEDFHVLHAERLQEDLFRFTFHPYWETNLDRNARGYVLKKSELQPLLEKQLPRIQANVLMHQDHSPMASCMDHNVEILESLIHDRPVQMKYRKYVSAQFGTLPPSMTLTP